jgi:hypothetical protein
MEIEMNRTSLAAMATLATMLLFATAAGAQTGAGAPGEMREHHPMMEKLVEACNGKAANDPCSFIRPNGKTAKGTCMTMRDRLVCRPAGMGHRRGMGMGPGGMGGPGAMGGSGGRDTYGRATAARFNQ